MGKFDGILLCTDLDGTYTNGLDVCGDNLEYLDYFRKNGGLFTVATGRLPPYLDAFGAHLPTDVPVITHNGAVIYDRRTGRFLYGRPLENAKGEVRGTIRYILSLRVSDRVDMNAALDWIETDAALREDDTTVYYKGVVPCDTVEHALLLVDALRKEYGEKYCVFRSWSVGVEFLAPDTNKGTALAALRGLLGDRVRKTVAVGDFENDAQMLKAADLGIAVGNASAEAKAAADRVVCAYEKGAFAEVIRLLDDEMV